MSARTAQSRNRSTAGAGVSWAGRASPSSMEAAGARGSLTTSLTRFWVMRSFMMLTPSPCSTMAMAAKFSSVVKRTLGVTPERAKRAPTSSSRPSAGMMIGS